MDPDVSTATLFKWDLRFSPQQAAAGHSRALEEMFRAYGVRSYVAAKMADLGFTVSTLLEMKDDELDDMMNSVSQVSRVELLVGERYGIKAAVRAQRRRRLEEEPRHALSGHTVVMDDLSQEGLSEEPVQQEKEMVGSGGEAACEGVTAAKKWKRELRRIRRAGGHRSSNEGVDDDENEENEDGINGGGGEQPSRALAKKGGGRQRQREHPFIVTEAGEVVRGKNNGLDYLFHLYKECHQFLTQVQKIAKKRGEKCPTKVTKNKVFTYAKEEGADHINKPKMRHYVHCYALHCLDEERSNALRRECKLRGETIGAWMQECYRPVVDITAPRGWDIDAIFSEHPQLSVWYVPTKLRQLCHAERNNATASSSASGGKGTAS